MKKHNEIVKIAWKNIIFTFYKRNTNLPRPIWKSTDPFILGGTKKWADKFSLLDFKKYFAASAKTCKAMCLFLKNDTIDEENIIRFRSLLCFCLQLYFPIVASFLKEDKRKDRCSNRYFYLVVTQIFHRVIWFKAFVGDGVRILRFWSQFFVKVDEIRCVGCA